MNWQEVEFQELVDFYNHIRIPLSGMEREKKQGQYRYYGAQSVIDYIDDYLFDGEYVLIAEDGANLVTRKEPIAQIVDGQFWVNNHAHIVRAKTGKSTNRFINYLINSNNLSGYITGAAQPKLSQKNLRVVKFRVPPYEHQGAIDRIVTSYDNLIENNKRRIALLEESARQLYKEWFVRFRFPGHEHVKIVDGVPEGWVNGVVADLGEVVTGKTPSTKINENYGGDIPFIKTPDMHASSIVLQTEQCLSERGANSQLNKFIPKFSTLVACIGAGLGVVSLNSKICQTNQQINSIVPKLEAYTFYSYLTLKDFREKLLAIGGGATMPNVNKSKFSNMKILLPNHKLLENFHEAVAPSFLQMEKLTGMNQRLIQARELLLPKLMSGELTV